jgi:hypothetical protein
MNPSTVASSTVLVLGHSSALAPFKSETPYPFASSSPITAGHNGPVYRPGRSGAAPTDVKPSLVDDDSFAVSKQVSDVASRADSGSSAVFSAGGLSTFDVGGVDSCARHTHHVARPIDVADAVLVARGAATKRGTESVSLTSSGVQAWAPQRRELGSTKPRYPRVPTVILVATILLVAVAVGALGIELRNVSLAVQHRGASALLQFVSFGGLGYDSVSSTNASEFPEPQSLAQLQELLRMHAPSVIDAKCNYTQRAAKAFMRHAAAALESPVSAAVLEQRASLAANTVVQNDPSVVVPSLLSIEPFVSEIIAIDHASDDETTLLLLMTQAHLNEMRGPGFMRVLRASSSAIHADVRTLAQQVCSRLRVVFVACTGGWRSCVLQLSKVAHPAKTRVYR